MSRFFISNNYQAIEDNRNSSERFFKHYSQAKAGTVFSICFEKEINSYSNYYKNINDFCFCVGTCIYKGFTGAEAAKAIYNDFTEKHIVDIKKSAVGMYSVYIFKNNERFVFNDYYGLYDVCYGWSENYYYVGNSLKDIAQCYSKLVFSDYDLIMQLFQDGCFPDRTMFEGIKKMCGNEYMVLTESNIEINKIQDNDYQIKYEFESEQKALRDISSLMKEYATLINDCYHSESVFLTGGLDSRMIFGAFKEVNANINCLYGTGRGMEAEDKALAEKICQDYNCECKVLNWTHPEENSDVDWTYQKQVFDKIGFSNWISGGSRNQFESIKECCRERVFMAFGYYCEALRLRDWAADLHKDYFDIDSYIDDYYINQTIIKSILKETQGYREYIRKGLVSQLNDIGFSGDYAHIPLDKFERFRWKQSRFCDSRMEFFINNYTYSFSLMSVPIIHEMVLSLPAEIIRDGVFQVRLIKELDEKLISNYDVYSHMRLFKVNKKDKKIRKLTMKNVGDRFFEWFPFIKPLIVKVYRNYRYDQSSNNNRLKQQYLILSENLNLPINIIQDECLTYRIRQYLIGIKVLEGSSLNK